MDPTTRRREALEVALRRQQIAAAQASVETLIDEAAKIDKFLESGEAAGENE